VKRPKGKLKGKRSKGRGEPAKLTLAELLGVIDAAADEKAVDAILSRLSPGTRAILYSALLYTQPASDSVEQPRNRSYALQILREFLMRAT
jgi:hypothetical protein